MSASAVASTGIGAVMPSLLGVAGREREKFDPAQIHCRPLCYRWTVEEGSNPRRLTMFCPECGEVIGSGPLDARRARPGGGDGATKGGGATAAGRWFRAIDRKSVVEGERVSGRVDHGGRG